VHPQETKWTHSQSKSQFLSFLLGGLDLDIYLDGLSMVVTTKKGRQLFWPKKCTPGQNPGYAYESSPLVAWLRLIGDVLWWTRLKICSKKTRVWSKMTGEVSLESEHNTGRLVNRPPFQKSYLLFHAEMRTPEAPACCFSGRE